jgi:hypothetical protein
MKVAAGEMENRSTFLRMQDIFEGRTEFQE